MVGDAAPVGQSGGPERVFVGRAAELTVLRRAWQDVRRGRTRIVEIEGAPGVGKTDLARRFVEEAAPAQCVWVGADEMEADLAWGVVGQIALRWPASERSVDLGFPDDQLGFAVVGDRLRQALAAVGGGFVLVVDNAHWGDKPSMDALRYACRRLVSASVLVVIVRQPAGTAVALTSHSVSPGLHEGWRQVFGLPDGVQLRLDGLSAVELLDMAAASGHTGLSTGGAARLHAETGGNPEHVRLLLEQIPAGDIGLGLGGPLPAPHEPRAAVASRLKSCAPAARDLLETGAVLGETFAVADAQRMCGGETTTAAAEAVDTGLVHELPRTIGRDLGFRSSIVRSSVYHGISPARRRTLHRAAALLRGPVALWHRIEAADGVDGALAVDVEREARRYEARGDLSAAAFYFDEAFVLTPSGSLHDARLLTAIEALLVSGRAGVADRHAGKLEAVEPGPWKDYVTGYRALLAGKISDAAGVLEDALAAVRCGAPVPAFAPDDLEARTATLLALIAMVNLDYHRMVDYADAAVRAGTGQRWVAAFARFTQALGLTLAGRSAEALARLADVDVPGAPSGLDGLVARGMVRMWTDDLPGAEGDLRNAVARAADGESMRIGQGLGFLGELSYRRGALGEAVWHCDLALGNAERNARVWDYAMLHALACYPRAARGDWEKADEHARQAADCAELVGTRAGFAYAAGGRAALAQARGDPRRLLRAAEDIEAFYDSREPGTHLFGPLRADALAQLGRPDEADEVLAGFAEKAEATGRRSARMAVLRVRGQIAATRGEDRTAVDLYDEACALAQGIGLPLEHARLQLLAAECLHRLRKYDRAAQHLESALAQFNLAGASAYVSQVHKASDRLKLPVGDRFAAFRNLTAREHAVACSVTAGRTRLQTAEDLSIAKKTVDNHLDSVFKKLGVHSSKELRELLFGETT